MESTTEEMSHVEAVLYTTGKYMNLQEIADACGIGSVGLIKEAIEKLKEQYITKESGALEIQENEGKFKLNIKKKYGFIASRLSGEAEFDGPTMKTLAVIAYKSPVEQSEIIHIRGNKAYDHISQLKEDGLLSAEKSGRTRSLKLTSKFFEYFDVAEKEVKEKFQDMEESVRKNVAWKMGTTPEHIEQLAKSIVKDEPTQAAENLQNNFGIETTENKHILDEKKQKQDVARDAKKEPT